MAGEHLRWGVLLLLGASHGINPAMGWLFAVALGLQEQRRAAVWRALGPLAAGHALAMAAALAVALALGAVMPLVWVRWIVAAALLTIGVRALVRHRHPRWGGMRVGGRDLTIWSFLMASAHGAGLMAVPFVLGASTSAAMHAQHVMADTTPLTGLLATLIHAGGYLAVTGALAVLVYEKMGLRLLRSAWINIDAIWAGALVCTAVLTIAI
jgi:hypothetical protein